MIRAPQWLGDAVVSTVFIQRLKQRYPQAELTVLSTVALRPVFERHPSVSATLALPYPSGTIWDAGRLCREKSFDVVYILPRSFRTALEARLAAIPLRIGFSGDGRRFLLTEAFRYDPRLPYAHRYLKLIGEEQLSVSEMKPFFPSESLEPSAAASLFGAPLEQWPRPFLGIAPASIAPSRTWNAERFVELAARFRRRTGGTAVIFGSPQEKGVAQSVVDRLGEGAVNTAGLLSLPQLGWMVSQCDGLVVNDSGLMHVAGCFGRPTVVVFGASDPAFAVPLWGRFSAIQHKEIDCVPCLRNHCVRLGSFRNACLSAASTDEVEKKITDLMK